MKMNIQMLILFLFVLIVILIFRKIRLSLKNYVHNITQISKKIKNDCLIIVQSTLPPGTTEKILKPLIKKKT